MLTKIYIFLSIILFLTCFFSQITDINIDNFLPFLKEDTKNILNAVTSMRNITDMLGSTVLSKLAAATAGNVNTSTNSDILEQNVHIDAQFPNVTNSREIEEALNNLVNMASMRANKR